MNDWWNDPPDEDYPRLSGRIDDWDDPDPPEDYGELVRPEKCPHGNEWGECERCDFEGDLAYDAHREG